MSISRRMTSSSLASSSGGNSGVLHDVAENIYRDTRAGVRHVNVIDGAIKAGVGVHVTARFRTS